MRNQYKRDINRLVQHPRRRPGSRPLRNPGGVNSVYSSASGLTRSAGTKVARVAFEPSEFFVSGSSDAGRRYWGEPLFDESGDPINPPLGTEYGDNPVWTMDPRHSRIEKGSPGEYGNRNWVGPDDTVLSWDGPPGRVFDYNYFFFDLDRTLVNPEWQSRWYTSGKIYKDLGVLFDLENHSTIEGDSHVHGAAIHSDQAGDSWLYLVASPYWFRDGQTYRSYRIKLGSDGQPSGGLEQLHEFVPESDIGHISHWYFNQAGDKAVCTFRRYLQENNMSLWAVCRYDINSGFEYEVTWDRDVLSVGTNTRDFERVADDDSPDYDLHVTQDYSGVVSVDEHLLPVYTDFKGNDEVAVYIRMPQRTDSNVYSFEQLAVSTQGEEENWRKSTQTISEGPERPQAIVTSEGQTLFEFPLPAQQSLSRTIDEDNLADTVTLDYSYTETWADPMIVIGMLAVDARYDFAAVGYDVEDVTISAQGTETYQTDSPGGTRYADFPATGNFHRREEIQVWLGGEEVGTLLLEEEIGQIQSVRIRETDVMPEPDHSPSDGSSYSFNDSTDVTPMRPPTFSNNSMLTAAGYSIGGKSVAGVALWNSSYGAVEGMVWSQLDGHGSVKQDLLGQSESDLLVLHRIGLF